MSRLGIGRTSGGWRNVAALAGLMSGGIYFIEPGLLGAGWTDDD